jgi:hypothetical protein
VTRGIGLALAGLVSVLTRAGCASRTLDVGYPEAAANRALLASVTSRRVVVTAVTDRRPDKGRIGSTPHGAKPIVSSRPLPDIVHEALVVELGKNGHRVVAGPADIVVAADLEEFWLDAVGPAERTQYVGRVAIAVTIADAGSGDRLFTRRYIGVKRRIAKRGFQGDVARGAGRRPHPDDSRCRHRPRVRGDRRPRTGAIPSEPPS